MAKSFVLQLASLATLFVSLPAFILLVFSIINLAFPDAAESYWRIESAQSSIRYTIAVLAVFFPAYIFITRKVNNGRRDEGELYHKLTKWFIYIALLIAGMVMLGDLATVVFYFLNGEITIRFILKALAMLLIIGGAFYYYLLDAKDYWNKKETVSKIIGAVVSVVVIVFAVIGYMQIDSPSQTREIKIDQQQVSDLQNIHWKIQGFYQTNGVLPDSIDQAYPDFPAPIATEGRAQYEYNLTGAETYQLCATFSRATPESERNSGQYYYEIDKYSKNNIWDHGEGQKCFDRVVFPEEVKTLNQ